MLIAAGCAAGSPDSSLGTLHASTLEGIPEEVNWIELRAEKTSDRTEFYTEFLEVDAAAKESGATFGAGMTLPVGEYDIRLRAFTGNQADPPLGEGSATIEIAKNQATSVRIAIFYTGLTPEEPDGFGPVITSITAENTLGRGGDTLATYADREVTLVASAQDPDTPEQDLEFAWESSCTCLYTDASESCDLTPQDDAFTDEASARTGWRHLKGNARCALTIVATDGEFSDEREISIDVSGFAGDAEVDGEFLFPPRITSLHFSTSAGDRCDVVRADGGNRTCDEPMNGDSVFIVLRADRFEGEADLEVGCGSVTGGPHTRDPKWVFQWDVDAPELCSVKASLEYAYAPDPSQTHTDELEVYVYAGE